MANSFRSYLWLEHGRHHVCETAMRQGKGIFLLFGGLLLALNVVVVLLREHTKSPGGGFPYNPASTVVVSEFVKLGISSLAFAREFTSRQEKPKFTLGVSNCLKYAIPGLLYAVSNVGNFIVLQYISSTQFQVFNNLKIVTTAVVFRVALHKPLKVVQWYCLFFLALGMSTASQACDADTAGSNIMIGFMMMLLMSLCSAFAGVYNEFLLKGSEDSTHFQNMQIYIWGVVICLGQFETSMFSIGSFFEGYTAITWLIIILMAFYGQVVSFTLKYADNIVKVYANSLAALASAVVANVIFETPLTAGTLNSSAIVALSCIMYYGNHSHLTENDTIWLYAFDDLGAQDEVDSVKPSAV